MNNTHHIAELINDIARGDQRLWQSHLALGAAVLGLIDGDRVKSVVAAAKLVVEMQESEIAAQITAPLGLSTIREAARFAEHAEELAAAGVTSIRGARRHFEAKRIAAMPVVASSTVASGDSTGVATGDTSTDAHPDKVSRLVDEKFAEWSRKVIALSVEHGNEEQVRTLLEVSRVFGNFRLGGYLSLKADIEKRGALALASYVVAGLDEGGDQSNCELWQEQAAFVRALASSNPDEQAADVVMSIIVSEFMAWFNGDEDE